MNRTVLSFALVVGVSLPVFAGQKAPADYVDPQIGNVAPFLKPTYPTFQQPNQMLRVFPIRGSYLSDQVQAFPLQVLSHRSPGIFRVRLSAGPLSPADWTNPMAIDYDLEIVHPWRYETVLIERDITVGFAPGKKAGIYRFEFPQGKEKNILISGKGTLTGSAQGNAFSLVEEHRHQSRSPNVDDVVMSIWCYGEITDAQGQAVSPVQIAPEQERLSIQCAGDAPDTLQLKYAISYVSVEQARANFEAELAGTEFDELSAAARHAWDAVLGKIAVEGGTEAQRRTFYTALYKAHERMVDINEGGHYFSAYDQKVHASDRPFYIDDWVWDSFRAQHPLRTIIAPAQQEDMLNSYVEMYRQSGWMPTFPQLDGNHQAMTGYHSASLFLDAYRKGLKHFDLQAAYEGVRKNLTEGTWIPWRQGAPKTELDGAMEQLGYMPGLRPGDGESVSLVDRFERRQSVAVTLGRSYDAWVMSEWAGEMGRADDQKMFARISQDYQKLWHSDIRLFMPKDAEGNWIYVDPKTAGGQGFRDYYDENNGWTYAWMVPHDVAGLKKLLGGDQAMAARLDQLFRESFGARSYEFYSAGPDSTGMVGQFSMGNEPSFHIPYLYNYCGAPWKTQQRTRFLLDVWFKDNIFGIPGDEDGGAMSSWVVLTSMGIYPVTPGEPVYTITSPVFSKVSINLPDEKQFAILAPGASARNKYIQRAELNGQPLNTPFISHEAIMAGGTLFLELGERPNRSWGVK